MRLLRITLFVLLDVLLLCGVAAAQDVSVRYQGQAISNRGLPLASQSVAVCTQPAVTTTQPCSPLATLATSTSTSSGGANPTTTDANGNFFFYAAPGKYTVQIYGPQVQTPFVQPDTIVPISTTGQNSISVFNLSGITIVDGNKYTTVASALSAVVTAGGGFIHAEGCSISSCLTLGTLDVGNHSAGTIPAVTIYLGSFNYTATQIVLRAGFHIYGLGNGDASGSGTVIKATSTTTPVIVGPQACNDVAAQHSGLDNIRFTGAASSTADGMFLDTAGLGNNCFGGVWYSQFHNLAFDGFGGADIHIRGGGATGGTNQGVNQWLSFYDTTAIRTNGGGSAVRIEGANYQQFFYGGQYDSIFGNSNIDTSATPNVYVGCGSCTSVAAQPYIIDFIGPTIEGAATLVQVDGAEQVHFEHPHHEQGFGAYLISTPSVTFVDLNVVVRGSSFNGTVGTHAGAGYLMNVTASQAMGVLLEDSVFPGNGSTPDHYFENTGSAPLNCCEVRNQTISNSAGNWPAKPLPTTTLVGRVAAVNGTALTTGAFAFNTGGGAWGTGPAFNSVRGTDGSFVLTLTSGSGAQTANPTFNLTFVDGTWTNVPVCVASTNTAPATWGVSTTSTATVLTVFFNGTPVASTQYTLAVNCNQSPN